MKSGKKSEKKSKKTLKKKKLSAAVQSKAAERRPRGPVGKGTAPKKRK